VEKTHRLSGMMMNHLKLDLTALVAAFIEGSFAVG
jgi:hypothetical protein